MLQVYYKILLAFKCLNSKRVNLISSRHVLIGKIVTFAELITSKVFTFDYFESLYQLLLVLEDDIGV